MISNRDIRRMMSRRIQRKVRLRFGFTVACDRFAELEHLAITRKLVVMHDCGCCIAEWIL